MTIGGELTVNLKQVLWMLTDGFHLQFVVASAYAMHVSVEGGVVELLDDALGASQYGSIVVQEVYPMVDVDPMGLLV